jgi:cytochrome P450
VVASPAKPVSSARFWASGRSARCPPCRARRRRERSPPASRTRTCTTCRGSSTPCRVASGDRADSVPSATRSHTRLRSVAISACSASSAPHDVYYDPYDVEIDTDPYPVFRRLRDEAPLYYNEKHDFYAVSRFDDVERGLIDWRTFISGRGHPRAHQGRHRDPAGVIIFEDPPTHTAHRGCCPGCSRPGRWRARAEGPRVLRRSLDPLVGSGRLRLHRRPRRADADADHRHAARHPEEDQEAIRDRSTPTSAPRRASRCPVSDATFARGDVRRVHRLAGRAPLRRPDDRAAHAEFEDETGTVRRLTRDELLTYVTVLAGAGNETTTRLIGWTGKVLAEHPDQRRSWSPTLAHPQRHRGAPALRAAVAPVQARYVTSDVELHGQTVPAGSVMLLLNGSANRDDRRSPTATASTSTARSTTTSPSATASTSASAPRWPGSRAGSPSRRC